MSYAQEILDFLIDYGSISPEQLVSFDDSLLDQGIIDSMVILELTEFITSTYNIRINPLDLVPANFESLNAIQNYIQKNSP